MNETVQEADHKASSVTEIQFELPAKASYYVWVRAHNAGGPGRPSAKVAVSTELGEFYQQMIQAVGSPD